MDFHADMRDRILGYVERGEILVNAKPLDAVIQKYGCTYQASVNEVIALRKLLDRRVVTAAEFDQLEFHGVTYQRVTAA